MGNMVEKRKLWNGLHEYLVNGTVVDNDTYERHLVAEFPDCDEAVAARERFWEPSNQMINYLKAAHQRGDVIRVTVPSGHPVPTNPTQFVVDVTPRGKALLVLPTVE